jgi:hypothetical protein
MTQLVKTDLDCGSNLLVKAEIIRARQEDVVVDGVKGGTEV